MGLLGHLLLLHLHLWSQGVVRCLHPRLPAQSGTWLPLRHSLKSALKKETRQKIYLVHVVACGRCFQARWYARSLCIVEHVIVGAECGVGWWAKPALPEL